MGLNLLSIGDADLVDVMMDCMINKVPVFKVDVLFFDPAAAKHVSHLAHPVLLTVTLLLHTMLQTISQSLTRPGNNSSIHNPKETLTLGTVDAMQAILQDLHILSEALEENKEHFAHDQLNFGAQQVSCLTCCC